MEACRRGDLHAYERLYQLHASKMKSFAFHMLGSRADAEDAVQDAFLKIYQGMNQFEGQAAISTWMFRILINCCYDSLRKQQRKAEDAPKNEIASDPKLALKVTLERSLARLGERQRLVFLMFEVEGLKHSEISAVLQVPEGTSRSWLFEAKRDLKRMLMGSST